MGLKLRIYKEPRENNFENVTNRNNFVIFLLTRGGGVAIMAL